MTEESDPFLYAPFSLPGDDRMFTAAAGNDCPHEKKIFNSVFLLFRGLEMCYHTQ